MKEKGRVENQEVYKAYLLAPLIKTAVLSDQDSFREYREKAAQKKGEIYNSIWGVTDGTEITIPPSIAANCLRWWGYQELGYKPAPRTFEQEMNLMIGSSAHFSLSRKLKEFGLSEQNVISEEAGMAGRLDFFFKNPKTGEWQVADFKTTSSFGFRQITREGLDPELKSTKNIYSPSNEAKRQVFLYMWAKRQEGFNVSMGNVIYINKDNGQVKEALVLWNAKTEYDVNTYLGEMLKAQGKVRNGELPDPTVKSPHICASFCPYRGYCEYGQVYAAGKIKKEAKRRPAWVYKEAKKEAEQKRRQMEELGVVQPRLISDPPDFEK